MIRATNKELETTEFVRFSCRDFLDTLISSNGRGAEKRVNKRVQRFCDKYNLSQSEYEWIKLLIENSRFEVI